MLKYNNIRIRREDDDKLNMLKNMKGMSKTELVSELLQNVSEKVIDQVLDKDPDFYEIKRHILKPSYKKRESSRPPTAILDACILNQLKFNGSNPIIKTRNELKRGVVDFLSKGWIQLFKSFAKDRNGDLYIGSSAGIGKYEGYNDNGSTYRFRYRSPGLTFGDPSKIKLLKKIRPVIIGGNDSDIFLNWSYDFEVSSNTAKFRVPGD